jgi:hypothetical protein
MATTETCVSNRAEVRQDARSIRIAGMPLAAVVFLALSALIALVRSHYHLLWADEFGILDTDSIPSLSRLIHIQLTTPVSFDPIGYNALLHTMIRVFGGKALPMRAPSIVGYLTMQVCLFFFVRRIATERAAIFALAFPALVGVVSYSVQARPYGLLLGLAGIAMVSWQAAARRESDRTAALVTLALSLGFAVNVQYYGVLLFAPVCAAECFRIFERRRMDYPMLASIVAGMAGMLVVMPFARALSTFRSHYTGVQAADVHFIIHSYFWLVMGYVDWSIRTQHIAGVIVFVAICAMVIGFVRLRSRFTLRLPKSEAVFILILLLFPVLGYVLGNYVMHFVESRYIVEGCIGITVLISILVTPILQNDRVYRLMLVLLLLAIAGAGVLRIRTESLEGQETMASLRLSAETQHSLQMTVGQKIYTMNPSTFSVIRYYAPNADFRSRIGLTYSSTNEMAIDQNDYVSHMGDDLRIAGVRNVMPYKAISLSGTDHLFLLYDNPWDWTRGALLESHAKITDLGQAFGGDLVSARFP